MVERKRWRPNNQLRSGSGGVASLAPGFDSSENDPENIVTTLALQRIGVSDDDLRT